ncbi:MAG: hypothetical protein NTX49_10185 [Chlamydiae bacterium]|nr:hypothetical protein [Chlamydiota bacterium]
MASVTPVTNLPYLPLPSKGCDSTFITPPLTGAAGSLETTMQELQARIVKVRDEHLSLQQKSSADAERLQALLQSSKDALQEQGTSITELTANVSEVASQLRALRESVKPSLDRLQVPLPASTVVSYSTYEVHTGGD